MIFSAISADELQYFRFFDRNHYFTMQSFHLLFLWKIGHRKFWEHGRLCIWNQLARVSHRTAKKCDPIDLKYAEVPLLPWFRSSNIKVGNIYQGKFFEVGKWWFKFNYSTFLVSEGSLFVLHDIQNIYFEMNSKYYYLSHMRW